mmetsp:Transcript_159939/g.513176  ORF Transcript_159939/g.513176 Transcript_159939/m.513176 type:complete len:218 (+) Transcript_159939:1355-2008(+)
MGRSCARGTSTGSSRMGRMPIGNTSRTSWPSSASASKSSMGKRPEEAPYSRPCLWQTMRSKRPSSQRHRRARRAHPRTRQGLAGDPRSTARRLSARRVGGRGASPTSWGARRVCRTPTWQRAAPPLQPPQRHGRDCRPPLLQRVPPPPRHARRGSTTQSAERPMPRTRSRRKQQRGGRRTRRRNWRPRGSGGGRRTSVRDGCRRSWRRARGGQRPKS